MLSLLGVSRSIVPLSVCGGVEVWEKKGWSKKEFGFVEKEYVRRRMELLSSIEIEIDLM